MRHFTILFDFDGTLADTERAMQASLNSISREFGFSPILDSEKEILRGMSASEFLRKRLGVPVWNVYKASHLFRNVRRAFAAHSADVKLFSGVPLLLKNLHAAGYRIGIVSTNSAPVIQGILGDSSKDIDFLETGSLMFGKSRALRRALKNYGVDRNAVVYVGDEVRDARSCRGVGIPMIGVGWGLNHIHVLAGEGIDIVATHEELVEMLKNYG